jgi:ligand-binding sensor domain-containing protein
MLNALTTIRIWEAGFYDTRGAMGWMRVDARKEWAGLPGVMHALMFAVTEDGIFVIEPQNGKTVKLADYPNRFYNHLPRPEDVV